MNIHKISGYLLFWLLLSMYSTSIAQSLSLYNMPYLPKSIDLNPAITPLSGGYLGLPVISHLNFSASNNFTTLSDIGLEVAPLKRMFEAPESDQQFYQAVAQQSSERSRILTANTVDLFSLGFNVNKGFVSFSVSERLEGVLRFSEALPRLLSTEQQELSQREETTLDLSQLRLAGTAYRTFNLNYARHLSPALSVGIRLGYVQGHSSLWLSNEQFQIKSTSSGFYPQGEIRALQAGAHFFREVSDSEEKLVDQWLKPQNTGFTFGLGTQYRIKDKWELGFSANNIGFINWKKDSEVAILAEDLSSGPDTSTLFSSLLEETFSFAEAQYRTPLAMELAATAHYYFRPQLSVGAMIHTSMLNGSAATAFSLSLNARLNRFIGLTTAYHHIQNFPNLGGGLSVNLGPIQFYVVSDNALSILTGNGVSSLQGAAGIYINFKRESRSDQLARLQISVPALADTAAVALADTSAHVEPSTVNIPMDTPPAMKVSDASSDIASAPSSAGQVWHEIGHGVPIAETTPIGALYPVLPSLAFLPPFASPPIPVQQEETIIPEPPSVTTPIQKSDPPKNAAPVVIQTQTRPTPTQQKQSLGVYFLTGSTSFRRGATSSAGVISRFQSGDRVDLLEKTNRYWWKVRYNGIEGWVKAALLE